MIILYFCPGLAFRGRSADRGSLLLRVIYIKTSPYYAILRCFLATGTLYLLPKIQWIDCVCLRLSVLRWEGPMRSCTVAVIPWRLSILWEGMVPVGRNLTTSATVAVATAADTGISGFCRFWFYCFLLAEKEGLWSPQWHFTTWSI